MIWLLAGALVGALAGPVPSAAAPQWRDIGRDRDGMLSYDPASLTRQGSRVRVVTRMVATTGPGDPPYSLIVRQEIDCRTPSSATLAIAQYDAGPEPVRSRTIPAAAITRDPIHRGSNLAGLYRAVCPAGAPLGEAQKGPPIRAVPPR